jgi:hypothetical protein
VLGQSNLFGFGFYTLHIIDPAVVLIVAAWGASMRVRLPQGGLLLVPVALIAALISLAFVRGMIVDSAPALLWARANLAIAAIFMLATTCSLSSDVHHSIRRALVVSAVLLCGLAALRLATSPSLFMINGVRDQDINDGGRALSASGAFLISLAAAIILSDALRFSARRLRRLALFLTFVLIGIGTGQGTATVALGAMCGTVLLIERGPLRGTRAVLGTLLLIVIAVIASTPGVADLFATSGGTFDLAHRSDNFQTRQAIWSALKIGFAKLSAFDQIFGLPAGQLPDMFVTLSDRQGRALLSEWTLSIHSMYYGSLPMMGYVGLSAYIFLLVLLSLGSLASTMRTRANRVVPAYAVGMCLGTAILSISYEVRNEELIGIFLAITWYRFARSPAPRPMLLAPLPARGPQPTA